jgi:hypothetical protein
MISYYMITSGDTTELDDLVIIRRTWNDAGRTAAIPLSQIEGLLWDRRSGGTRSLAPQAFIHGYVPCDEPVGNIAHSGVHGECPHQGSSVIKYDMLK